MLITRLIHWARVVGLAVLLNCFVLGSTPSLGSEDVLAEREFTLTIGSDTAHSKNCILLGVNGDAPFKVGCDRKEPGGPSIASSFFLKLKVFRKSINRFKLILTSLPTEGGTTKKVFESDKNIYVAGLNYVIKSQTLHSIDLWINANGDGDYRDFHAILDGPGDIKFGIDYLPHAGCDGEFIFQSAPITSSPPGANSANFKLALTNDVNELSSPPQSLPLATVDVYTPGNRRIVNHLNIYQSDFPNSDVSREREFMVPFLNSYPSIKLRVCSYFRGGGIRFISANTQFNPKVPYSFVTEMGKGAKPIDTDPNVTGRAKINIDFSAASTQKNSLFGIMRGLNERPIPEFLPAYLKDKSIPNPQEVAEMLRPLKPGIWRAFPRDWSQSTPLGLKGFDYAKQSGIPVIANLFLLWGGITDGKWKHHLGAPHAPENLSEWKHLVRTVIAENGNQIRYLEIWNEPENEFWPKTESPEDLYRLYVATAKTLKTFGEMGIKMTGLGLNAYNREYFREFLEYALKNNVEVNALTWHELGPVEYDLSRIAEHIRDAREQFFENPRYKALHLEEIHINESLSTKLVLFPGDAIATLFYLTQGGHPPSGLKIPIRAAKDCWKDPYGIDRCTDGSIDGLFVPPNKYNPDPKTWYQPRANYWAYKNYAAMLDQNIPCTSTNKNIVCFAGGRDQTTGEAKVLLGYYGLGFPFNAATVRVELTGIDSELKRQGRVHVKVERIPNAGDNAVSTLPIIKNMEMRVVGGKLNLEFSGLFIHEGAVLTLTKPKGNASPPKRLGLFR